MNIYKKSDIPEHLQKYFEPAEIGLEQTPEQYIAAMVEVFRCVRDVLADDGTLWVNIGDSYARNAGPEESKLNTLHTMGVGQKKAHEMGAMRKGENRPPPGCKPKDLIGVPWMLAFALRADGWFLRQDIIWHKPNPMPESVRDRCTKAHEYVFLLSKSERYFFDHVAIQEPETMKPQNRLTPRKANPDAKVHGMPEYRQQEGGTGGGMRNRRSVWSVNTAPYGGAHFATFPPALIEPCILAGSRTGDVVLDPFMGSGTTAQVAQALGRQWIGCELNPEYAPLQQARTAQAALAI